MSAPSRPIRVVDVTSFFSTGAGGIKRYYREKAVHLPPLGFECHFVVPGATASAEAFGAGTLHRLPGPVLPGNDAYRLFDWRSGVGRALRELDPDVVELGSHYVLPWMVRRALRARTRPPAIVGFFHSHPAQVIENIVVQLPGRAGAAPLERAVWSIYRHHHARYDATFVASRYMERLVSAHGVPNVRWVGLGVDVDVFRPDAAAPRDGDAAPVIAYAGRFTPDKELPALVRAFERVHARTGARLRLVGDGPLAGWLRERAAANPGLTVDGYVDGPAAVAAILASADLVAVPSSTETFSLTTAEALACGTPVVAADEGAAGELIEDSGGGALFRARDASALADRIEALLARPAAERRALGARGRAHVAARLTWAAVNARIATIYDELAGLQRQPDAPPRGQAVR